MSALALPASETVFWLLVLVVALVVVFGAVAVLVMLLSMLRSISLSMAQLREVVQAQTTQTLVEQQPAARGEAAEPGSGPGPGEPTDGAAAPDRGAEGADAREGEPEGRRPEGP